MRIGGRPVGVVLSALFEARHYIAARNMLRIYQRPREAFERYVLRRGQYPAVIVVNTPQGPVSLTTYSHDDILTVNEVFCRVDYPVTVDDRIIVDFGSNIGITGAYFLTSAPNSFVYLYEPVQFNIDRLINNLRHFEGRYSLDQVAVGETDGEVSFGWEETGRYGGVGRETGKYITVRCRDANEVLEGIIARHGRIDVLKIDIETLERQVTERITRSLARNIGRIYVELPFKSNPLEQTHSSRKYGSVTQFVNKEPAAGRR
jgi:FkbM family methyltransferase